SVLSAQFVCAGACLEFVFVHLDVVFFFSSRRRHTRCYRDWSSDVCSSDLWRMWRLRLPERGGCRGMQIAISLRRVCRPARRMDRSEERRVGKEWRCGGWPGGGEEKRERSRSEA